jgi:hypothetical protein
MAFGFDETQARAAVDAIGDKGDAQLAISWLLDHGEEDKGGAVVFRHCLHLDKLWTPERLVSTRELSLGRPCASCASVKENWICLFCGLHLCSRYVAKHSLSHWQETREAAGPSTPHGHHLMLSESDLSVWCHVCEAYIDNDEVQPHVEKLRAVKFGDGGAASSSSPPAGASVEESTSLTAGESERARSKRKAPAGMVAIPEDPEKAHQPASGDGVGKAPPTRGGASSPPSPPAPMSLLCITDASPDVEWLAHRWEQSMVLADRLETHITGKDDISNGISHISNEISHISDSISQISKGISQISNEISQISDESAQQAAAPLKRGDQEVSPPVIEPSVLAAERDASAPVPTRDLEVKSQVSTDSLDAQAVGRGNWGKWRVYQPRPEWPCAG